MQDQEKGGASGLKRLASGNQPTSKGSIQEKINDLHAAGKGTLANRLEKAANDKTLGAMVVKTKADGPKALEPDIQLKNWHDIGQIKWNE